MVDVTTNCVTHPFRVGYVLPIDRAQGKMNLTLIRPQRHLRDSPKIMLDIKEITVYPLRIEQGSIKRKIFKFRINKISIDRDLICRNLFGNENILL